jgi:hypothetical protein
MRFAEIEWTNQQNLVTATQLVVHSIQDAELPVQIQSAKTIKDLIPNESARAVVGPLLPQVNTYTITTHTQPTHQSTHHTHTHPPSPLRR